MTLKALSPVGANGWVDWTLFGPLIIVSSVEYVNLAQSKVCLLHLYLYKIVGLFDLCDATPPRPLTLDGWRLDMLTSYGLRSAHIHFHQNLAIFS